MIRRTFGAPFGGTTVERQAGFESSALMLMTPANGGADGGRWLPSMLLVAFGAPGVPVVCPAFLSFDTCTAPDRNFRVGKPGVQASCYPERSDDLHSRPV